MMSLTKIKVMVGWVLATLLGGMSVALAADDILIWEYQHSPRPAVQEAQASAVDSHGNLIITGYTDATGNEDFYTIKVRSDGQGVLWETRHDHPLGDDRAVAMAVDGNDDVIVAGFFFNGVNNDIAIVKYDGTSGLPKWAAPYVLNGSANGNDAPLAMVVDSLNNIYVAGFSHGGGSTGDDAILFKLSPHGPNPDGTPIWQVHYNGPANGDDRFNGLSAGLDGLAVTGHSSVLHPGGRQDFDYLTMKVDYTGNALWQKTYDHGSGSDVASYLGMDAAGNVVVCGKVMADGVREDIFTIKYAAGDGAPLWSTAYGAGSPNLPGGLVVDSDGEVYVTGNTFTTSGKVDFYTARYRGTDGAPVWQQVFDSGLDNSDKPSALALDSTGGLYVTGVTHKETPGDDDFQTIKYNKTNGNQIWQQAEDGTPVGGDQQPVGVAVALSVSADGNVYVAGWSQELSDVDYYAVKYSAALLNSPTGLSATVVSQNQIDLTWQDNSNAPNNEDSFCVERCQGFGCNDYTAAPCVAVPQNQTFYSDGTVSRDQWYSYRIKGQSSALGDSLPSPTVSVLSTLINYPAPDWLYTHDTEGLDDAAHAIAMGSDNQPLATGMSATANSQYDYYTVKLDRANAAIPFWVDSYDGPDGQGDVGVCLAVDSNNEVVVSGFSSINAGQGVNTNDIFTIKYAATGPDIYNGDPLWAVQYNGPGNDDDRSTAVASAADGSNFTVVTGYGKNAAGNEDIYLIKYKPDYDAASQEVWAITPFDGGFNDFPETTAFTPEGDVLVVGATYNATDSDLFIGKYSGATGAMVTGWPYTHDFGHGADRINAVAVAGDGSIYVAGFAMNAAGNLDIYINKFDGAGSPQWGNGKIIDGAGHGYDEAHAIAIDPNDGDIVVGATITSLSGSNDFHVLRYQADGTLRWQRTLEQIGHDEMLVGMAMSPSGEICLAGETEDGTYTDVIAVKYDHLGNLIGSTKFDNGFDDYASAITVNRLGEFYIAGYSVTGEFVTDDYDFVVFRFNGQELQAPSPLAVITHNTSVDLSWRENDTTASGYAIYRKNGACTDGGSTFEPANLIHGASQGTTAFTDSGLNIGSTYCYGVQAYRSGNSQVSRIIERQVTTTTPVAPDNLVALVKNTSEVEVCWHDNSASEDGFTVQRCAGLDCDFSQVTTLTAPAETDEMAAATCIVDTAACDAGAGKVFRYRVQAFRGINGNDWRSAFSATSPSDTVTVPVLAAPTSLSATTVNEVKVDMQWTDNSIDESDFVVERCAGLGCGDFVEIGAVRSVTGNGLLLEMDEAAWSGAAGQILDYSGKGRAGTAFGGATTSAEARRGRSGALDGANDYLSAPLVIDQSSQSAGVTMMAWVKPTSTSNNYHYLFSTEDGTTASPRNSWGLLRYGATWHVATGEAVRSTGVAVSAGQWQHVAVVFSPDNTVRFYKNGVETTLNYLGRHATSANFTIGRQGVLNQNFFDGLVDEVAVYDRALSATEIQTLSTVGIFTEAPPLKWFTDATVSHSTNYLYRVKARKQTACGTDLSAASNSIPLSTLPPPPVSLSVSMIKSGAVALSWTPLTTIHTGFQIERCSGAGCTDFVTIGSTSGAVTFKDSNACFGADGVNRYQVKALGPWGESPASSPAQVVGGPTPSLTSLNALPVTEASVKLNWTYPNPYWDAFSVQRCAGLKATCDLDDANYTEVSGSPFTPVIDPALQALWHMEDQAWSGVTGEVTDSSGKGRHGTAKNGAVLDTPGATVAGVSTYGAARFDGVDDYVSTDLVVDQSITSPGATFMAWVYPTDTSSRWQHLISTDNGGMDWGLAINGTNVYADNGNTYVGGGSVTANTWQHLAVVFDPNVGVRVYKNGVLQSTNADLQYDTGTATVKIGRHPSAGNYFAGKMDEVAVFTRPLTGPEVGQYYNNTTPFSFTDVSGLSAGVTYNYRVRPVVNTSCGDWASLNTYSAVSALIPATPPAPSGLTVTQINTTQLDLAWQSNTTGETGFAIERCQGSNCSDYAPLASTGAGVTAYKDTSVCENTTYRYRLKAVKTSDPTWESAYNSTPVERKTAIATAVTTLTLDAVSESEIALSFNDVNQDETAYDVARCKVEAGIACDQAAQFTTLYSYPGSVGGLYLRYKMDEAAWASVAGEVQDSSGNNRHGRGYNGASTVSDGRFGRAGSFNGSTHYVGTTTNISQLRNSTGVTMEAWVYPTVTDGNPRHVLSTENGGYDWGIIAQNGKWYVNTGLTQYDTGLTVSLNTWQHITAVFTPQSGITFYKDAESVTINEIDYDLSTGYFTVGRNPSTSSATNYFAGRIDEVLVYQRPLTLAEVTAHNSYQEMSALYAYSDKTVQHSSTYFYRVTARKTAGCAWEKPVTLSESTPVPPAPINLTVSCNTTRCALAWQDTNGSESGYVVSRCDGASGACASPLLVNLGAGSQAYSDDAVCPGQTYTYRVWAEGAWGQTTFAEASRTSAAQPAAPAGFTAQRVSEVAIDLSWDYPAADESGVRLERCLGQDCTELALAPASKTYADNQLAPNSEYCYRVSLYKTAACGWQTTPTEPPLCKTTSLDAGNLTATPLDTTTVGLAWSDNAQTETASVVERCAGDLAACCGSDPAVCAGPFATVGMAGPNQHAYTDSSACNGEVYTYRVNTKGEGLGRGNGGCWTQRAPLTFTSFPPFAGVEVTIPYQPEMKADFSDIRFYDDTGRRELQYWLKQKTNATSATVWLMTGANPAIFLYYGNPAASDGSATDALFTEVYDTFQGSTVNPQKWVVINPASNKVSQANGLKFACKNDASTDAAVFSTKTFERAAGNELLVDLTVGANATQYRNDTFYLGWEQDQTSSAVVSANAAHLLQLTSYHTHYSQLVYEDNGAFSFTKTLYNDLTSYQVKVVLNGGQGAKYYLRGGAYADWQLLKETTTVRPEDDVLRVGFHQANHNITINQVQVKHASAQRGASVNFAAKEGDGVTCLTFVNTWAGSPTLAAQAQLAAAVAPSGLTAGVLDGTVSLAWNAGTGDEDEFLVERDCGGGYGQIAVLPGDSTTYSDAGMPLSTPCAYQVRGHKAGPCPWTSGPSLPASVLAPPAGPVLSVTAENAFQIRLDWTDATDEEGFEVEAMVFSGAWMPVASLPANQLSLTDSHGVNPSTSYTYRVRARRATGNSAWGVGSVTTPAYSPGAATCPLP